MDWWAAPLAQPAHRPLGLYRVCGLVRLHRGVALEDASNAFPGALVLEGIRSAALRARIGALCIGIAWRKLSKSVQSVRPMP
jgi:hypothetical protein